jgi:uncharacterized protein YgiB involved in biofilm formation
MKRSRVLYLAVLGTVGGLSGCSDEQPALVFNSLDECKASAQTTAEVCQETYDQTLANHKATAPRFNTQADCESDFGSGKCETIANPAGGSWFVPAFTGFMVAQLLNNNRDVYHTHYGYMGTPLYRTRYDTYGSWRTADNAVISGTGKVSVPSSVTTPATRAVTMSRSGFGSVASARSSFSSGGSRSSSGGS